MLKKPPTYEFPRNLEALSIGELSEYTEALNAEIQRVEQNKDRKKSSQDAAASVFK